MKKFSLFLLFLSLVIASCDQAAKPNVVFILADQWRAQSIAYAGNPDVKTPHLDQLAAESVNFVNATSTMPVCTPYRAMVMTGKYPLKTGMFMNDVSLAPKYQSLAEVYQAAGYQTAYIGKWHLDGNGRSAFIPQERRQGFDYWKVLECSHSYNNSNYWGNDDQKHKWEGYDAEAQTQDAITYIQAQAQKDAPFYLMLSWGPPHAPYQTAPQAFQDMYAGVEIQLRENVPPEVAEKTKEILRGYYAHCTALDTYINQLQEAIRSSGLEDNTIFVFTSDHGDMINSHFARKKQKIYAESAKVPFLLKYPALLGQEGQQSDFLLNTLDIFPTLLGMSGIAVPPGLDGEDITPVFLGQEEDTRAASLVACIQPFGQWKRAVGGKEFRGIITKDYTYAKDLSGDWLLFDDKADPFQLNNLVGDPAYAAKAQKLEKLLHQELDRLDDEFLPGPAYIAKWGHQLDSTGTVPYTR
ncbi:MAG: sulfatase [Bacteroidota bacterium]